jgi:hypothetical protein
MRERFADYGGFRARRARHRLVGAGFVATVENDLVTLFDQQLPGH